MLDHIPGVEKETGREFRYIENDDSLAFSKLFARIHTYGGSPLPKSGGMLDETTVIELPSGDRLFGISYRGDLPGWSAMIEGCCRALGLRWATIRDKVVVLSDGSEFKLADCSVKTDWK